MPGPGAYWIGEEERREVLDVIESGHLSRYGKEDDPRFRRKVRRLEEAFARHVGAEHALAVNSGTSALLSSLLAMGIRPGDEVIVPAYTFVASYSAIFFAGGVPVLADIDESLTLDPAAVERLVGPRTRFLMPVHMLGAPCDLEALLGIARAHGLEVLEDCAQAGGGSYRGKALGTWGAMGAFSLNVYKTIGAGDGGLLVTSDRALYERAFAVHDQGHKPLRTGVEVGARTILGMNFRMNELTGAVALAQLGKLDRILTTLRAKKAKLRAALEGLPGVRFRTLHDADGECATLLVLLFDSAARAAEVARSLGTKTVAESGWHVYRHMEHVLARLAELGRPVAAGAFAQTDDVLSRAINLSVGVVDPGLGSGVGIHIDSDDDEIVRVADRVRAAVNAAR